MSMPDLVCLSHLRWDFVFQRPNHLMWRFAKHARVHYVEEPIFEGEPGLRVRESHGVRVLAPHLGAGLSREEVEVTQRALLDRHLRDEQVRDFVLWFYTPMALAFTRHLAPRAIVYDCMDELSAFQGAHPELREHERELFGRADIVFTGGQSLYEAKRQEHPNVHAFPSSVDAHHFARARRPRELCPDPEDQAHVAHPRVGFFGVLDERLDVELLDGLAALRPDLQFVLVGPIVKIDPHRIPRRTNVHLLGPKPYAELPDYLAGWDVAMIPFARNDSTRFISPTKTLEYMAAGKPVVSTSIRDVVRPYGEAGLARIADAPDAFARAVDDALREDGDPRRARFDAYLAGTSWDRTWARMRALLEAAEDARARGAKPGPDRAGVA